MIVIDGQSEIPFDGQTKIVIGKFDGIHAGHKRLIEEITHREDNVRSLVFTFSFSSHGFIDEKERIMTKDEQYKVFDSLGVDYLVVYNLTEEASRMEPETFAREILCKRLHCKEIVCGPDLSFGYKGRGNVELLNSLKEELNIEVNVIDKVKYLGQDISSSRIRQALKDGNTYDANAMLGKEDKT